MGLFVDELTRTALAAREAISTAQGAVSSSIIQQLKDECSRCASFGQFSCALQVSSAKLPDEEGGIDRFRLAIGLMPGEEWHLSRPSIYEPFLGRMKREIASGLGLLDVSVTMPIRVEDHIVMELKVRWPEEVSNGEERRPKTNMTSTCPICQETKPVVALVPCGHLLCVECPNYVGQNCPVCRAHVSDNVGLFSS